MRRRSRGRVRWIADCSSHLSDDGAVAKMGHPVCGLDETRLGGVEGDLLYGGGGGG